MGYVIALLSLCFLILFHEFGHFIAARLSGVTVEEFAVGMGPTLWQKKAASGTVYSIRLIPVGGFCSMKGETDGADNADVGAPDSFPQASVWRRIFIVVMGPLFNLLLAFLLAVGLVCATGVRYPAVFNLDDEVKQYDIQEGDRILTYNGHKIHTAGELRYWTLSEDSHKPKTLHMDVQRGKEIRHVSYPAYPLKKYIVGMRYSLDKETGNGTVYFLSEKNVLEDAGFEVGNTITAIDGHTFTKDVTLDKYLEDHPFTDQPVRITYTDQHEKSHEVTVRPFMETQWSYGFGFDVKSTRDESVIKHACDVLYWDVLSTGLGLKSLFTGKAGIKDLSGPVMVVKTLGDGYNEGAEQAMHHKDTAKETFSSLLSLIILISVNLGVLNLLPIPALDGGHLIFYLFEVVFRKRVNPLLEAKIHQVVLLLLLVLMFFIYVKDIVEIIM